MKMSALKNPWSGYSEFFSVRQCQSPLLMLTICRTQIATDEDTWRQNINISGHHARWRNKDDEESWIEWLRNNRGHRKCHYLLANQITDAARRASLFLSPLVLGIIHFWAPTSGPLHVLCKQWIILGLIWHWWCLLLFLLYFFCSPLSL